MGFFSYKCSVSEESIPAYGFFEIADKYSEVVLVTPNNRKIFGYYDGYGRVVNKEGEFDIFEEVVRDLYPETPEDDLRNKYFDGNHDKYIKIVRQDHYDGEDFVQLATSEDCEHQGYFYDDKYIEKHFPDKE
ncbi:MAG: hypothetical protein ACOCRO_02340 [Halanaerobiales bacterium]